MKASLQAPILGLLLLLPLSTAHAQGPSLSPIANVSVNAGGSLNVNVIAVDAEGRLINLTAALPPFGTLNTPTIGTGTVVTSLTLAPSDAHVGDYTAAVTATAGGVSNVRVFQITVNAAGSDQAPVVTVAPWHEVTAGSALSFAVSAGDADGDAITSLTASGLPPGATFAPDGSNMAGMFEWTPVVGDVGDYDVLFTAVNALSGTGVTHVRVESPPTLEIIPIDDVTVEGGSFVSVPVHASGVPGAQITLVASLPTFATLDPPGTGTGSVNTTVTVSPPTGSAGTYHASITAISLGESVTEDFDIIVTGEGPPDNQAPVLTAPPTAMVEVGSSLSFDVTATDPDGDHVDLFGSALPPGSSFTDHGDDTGTFTWTPVSGQAGTYTASFTGFDNRGGSGSASTSITVTEIVDENQVPTVSAPPTVQVDEGTNLSFTVTASDPDGDHVTLSASSLPLGAMFTDNQDNTGTFTWTPDFVQSGTYGVAFLGYDGNGGTGTASTSIMVMDVVVENQAPTVSAPPSMQVEEGVNLAFTVTASDPDGDHVTLSASALPSGATFTDHLDNTGTFSWTPDFAQSGSYDVEFLGDDGNGGTGTATTSIMVIDVGGDGDGDVPGAACLIGKFKRNRDEACFRIKPIDGSFDIHDVVLSSIRIRFHDESVPALDGARIEVHCHRGRGHGADGGDWVSGNDWVGTAHGDDGDDDEGDDDDGPPGHAYGHCKVSCKDHHDDDRDCRKRGGRCDTLGIRVCFSTAALIELFEGGASPASNGAPWWVRLPCALVDAEILATLTNGATVVATFNPRKHHDHGHPGRDKHRHGQTGADAGDGATGAHEDVLNSRVRPNPLAWNTELSFTMVRDGRVRVAVYDMQGRVVKKLLDEYRAAGQQTLPWNGTDRWNLRVPNGVYFLRVQTEEGSVTRRVTVVK